MNIIEIANESGLTYYGMGKDRARFIHHLENFAALVAAHERKFIAEQWEKRYGYDKHGVAEFIRKRANTQGEQHEPT
jgi:hypothetical protein